MLKHIEEFGKYIHISGFKNAKIKDVEELLKILHKEYPNVEIQFFDAKYVATWHHLYFAALNALSAFKNRENISKSLAMETMLYASMQRQIRKAMELLGIKLETSEIAVLIIGEEAKIVSSVSAMVSARISAQHDDKVLELSTEKLRVIRKVFGISNLELKTVIKNNGLEKALVDLVVERMALLATQR